LIQALQASLLAREMSRQLAPDDKEKVAIAALLGNVAKLLLVMVDLDRFREISRRVAGGSTEASAANEVLGMSLKTLTSEILGLWGIPGALVSLSTGSVAPTEPKHVQRLDRIVGLAKITAQHLRRPVGAEREALIAEVRGQCVADGGVTGEVFDRWVSTADAQMAPVRALLESAIPEPAAANEGFPAGSVIDDSTPLAGRPNAVGKPANSHELVLSRLQDLTHLITERQSLSAILLTALECLHTGFGYSRSILLLRDAGRTRTPRMSRSGFPCTSARPVPRQPASSFCPYSRIARRSPACWSAATLRNRTPSPRKISACCERYAGKSFWQ
jgi:hypothetical protein